MCSHTHHIFWKNHGWILEGQEVQPKSWKDTPWLDDSCHQGWLPGRRSTVFTLLLQRWSEFYMRSQKTSARASQTHDLISPKQVRCLFVRVHVDVARLQHSVLSVSSPSFVLIAVCFHSDSDCIEAPIEAWPWLDLGIKHARKRGRRNFMNLRSLLFFGLDPGPHQLQHDVSVLSLARFSYKCFFWPNRETIAPKNTEILFYNANLIYLFIFKSKCSRAV